MDVEALLKAQQEMGSRPDTRRTASALVGLEVTEEERASERRRLFEENETRYQRVVDQFHSLFKAFGYRSKAPKTPSAWKTSTPSIVLAKTEEGPIYARVQTLSHNEPDYTENRWGTRPGLEQLPHFGEAENFKIIYTIYSGDNAEDRTETCGVKRNSAGTDTDHPAIFPWSEHGDEPMRIKQRLDSTLPTIQASLDTICCAAADPELNPDLAGKLPRTFLDMYGPEAA